jgi:hypothetical protein
MRRGQSHRGRRAARNGEGTTMPRRTNFYEVSLTIRTSSGEWNATWDATHTTLRLHDVYPPKAI